VFRWCRILTSDPAGSSDANPEEQEALSALAAAVEALLFAHGAPLPAQGLSTALGVRPADVRSALVWLEARCDLPGSGLRLRRVAGGYQLVTGAAHRDAIERLLTPRREGRLSHQAMETLSVIAYRQPITMPELNELRGAHSQAVVGTLLRARLVESRGRKPVVGRPLLYGTTRHFLERFGLDRIENLPQLEEVEKDEVPKESGSGDEGTS